MLLNFKAGDLSSIIGEITIPHMGYEQDWGLEPNFAASCHALPRIGGDRRLCIAGKPFVFQRW